MQDINNINNLEITNNINNTEYHIQEILDFASHIGKLLLENGAEAYRVEDTVIRVLKSFGIQNCSSISTTTGLFVCIGDKTKIERIKIRNINLYRLAEINSLSRKITEKKINLQDAKVTLREIEHYVVYSNTTVTISIGLCCAFFCFLFKGSVSDAISAFIVGFLLNMLTIHMSEKSITSFMSTCIGGIFVATMTLINLNIGIGQNIDNVIIGGVMPLVPGMCFTTAIRDIFEGDYLSGSSRMFEAIVIAIAIALGVGVVLSIWINIFGDFLII